MKQFTLITIMILCAVGAVFAGGQGESTRYNIGLCLFDGSDEMDMAASRAVSSYLLANGFGTVVFDAQGNSAAFLELADEAVGTKSLWGVIVIGNNRDLNAQVMAMAAAAGIPVGVLGPAPDDPENYPGIVVEYLPGRGYEDLWDTLLRKAPEENVVSILAPAEPGRAIEQELLSVFEESVGNEPERFAAPIILDNIPTPAEAKIRLKTAIISERELNLMYISVDYLPIVYPFLVARGSWVNAEDPFHITLGCLNGSEMAFKALEDGYIDAIGSRDLGREAQYLCDNLMKAVKGRRNSDYSRRTLITGKVITRMNMTEFDKAAWIEGYVPRFIIEESAADSEALPEEK